MRVLINGMQAGNRSGTGRYVEELLNAIEGLETDDEIHAVLPADSTLCLSRIQAHRLPKASRASQFMAEQWHLHLRGRSFDVVHYPASVGPLLPCGNLVLTVHDLAVFRKPEWFTTLRAGYYRLAMRRGVRQARHILADSAATSADLQEILRVPPEKIEVVPLGVAGMFSPASEREIVRAREEWKLPDRFLLYVGTIEPRKNLVRLIQAWSSVAEEIPDDLVIAGRLGWRFRDVLQAAMDSPARERIHFVDHVPDVWLPSVISAARAFVYPSLHEGFGLPPLEAMACGAPVLTSTTSSLPEVTGDAALVADPEDGDALARAMLRLGLENTLCEQLRERGLQRAGAFTWKATAQLSLDAFRRSMR